MEKEKKKKRVQSRIQLSFNDSEEHQRAFHYLSGLPRRTDYVTGLILRDLRGEREAPETPCLDYEKLAEALREPVGKAVEAAVRQAVPTPDLQTAGGPDAAAALPASSPPQEDMSLALEGLEAFGLL